MADLLESLETGLRSDVSVRLRSLVDRIDQFILSNRDVSTVRARRQSPNRIMPIESFDGKSPQIDLPQTQPFIELEIQSPSPMGQLGMEGNLPFEMLQDWPWPLDSPDNTILFPDILSGWSH